MRQDKDQQASALCCFDCTGHGLYVGRQLDARQVLDVLVVRVDDLRQVAAVDLRLRTSSSATATDVWTRDEQLTCSSCTYMRTSDSKVSAWRIMLRPAQRARGGRQGKLHPARSTQQHQLTSNTSNGTSPIRCTKREHQHPLSFAAVRHGRPRGGATHQLPEPMMASLCLAAMCACARRVLLRCVVVEW